jgi:hypothetical protein
MERPLSKGADAHDATRFARNVRAGCSNKLPLSSLIARCRIERETTAQASDRAFGPDRSNGRHADIQAPFKSAQHSYLKGNGTRYVQREPTHPDVISVQ